MVLFVPGKKRVHQNAWAGSFSYVIVGASLEGLSAEEGRTRLA